MADLRTTTTIAGRFEVRATASDHFAWVRTRLALERTIMSWLRAALATDRDEGAGFDGL